MTDCQINLVLDWLNYLSGRRPNQPQSFSRAAGNAKENLVRLCYAVCAIVPPGYEHAPLLSQSWQTRMTGRFEEHFEAFSVDELLRLIEGLKHIFRNQGQRDTQSLIARTKGEAARPLCGESGGQSQLPGDVSAEAI